MSESSGLPQRPLPPHFVSTVLTAPNTSVDKSVQTCREILWVYLSQTDDNCQEAKSQRIWKMLWRMAVLQHILYIRIKRGDIGLHEIPRWSTTGAGKKGNLWDWLESEMERHTLL